MINVLKTKLGAAAAVAAGLVVAGTIASASAASPPAQTTDLSGYTKDQCKHGGWQHLVNPNTGQPFKNQGQCVRFFTSGQPQGDGQGQGNGGGSVSNDLFHQFLAALATFFGFLGSFFGHLFGTLSL